MLQETADKVRQISGAGLDGDSYYGGGNGTLHESSPDHYFRLDVHLRGVVIHLWSRACVVVTLDDLSLDQVMSELSLDSHREVEENTFSNVLDQVVKELKVCTAINFCRRFESTFELGFQQRTTFCSDDRRKGHRQENDPQCWIQVLRQLVGSRGNRTQENSGLCFTAVLLNQVVSM